MCLYVYRSHTLAFVPSSNKVYSFGKGDSGQLGIDSTTSSNSCLSVKGPWIHDRNAMTTEEIEYKIIKVAAGGDHCFVTAIENSNVCILFTDFID